MNHVKVDPAAFNISPAALPTMMAASKVAIRGPHCFFCIILYVLVVVVLVLRDQLALLLLFLGLGKRGGCALGRKAL